MKGVSRRTHLSSSALPPEGTYTASPKAISRRTSYYRVRLAFHPHPQLISACCTAREFGPPPTFTLGSTWPWIAHPVSGLFCSTYSPVKTWFPYGYLPEGFNLAKQNNSQAHSSIGTPSPRRALALCKRTVSDTISSPSRGAFHLSLTVLVHYRSLSIFSLRP